MRKKVTDVFTPRRADVNHAMYVARPVHEKELRRAIDGSQHLLLYGESGNGKSWLYKNLLEREDIAYVAANCGNASRLGSITREIECVAFPEGRVQKDGYTEGKEVGANAYFAEGSLSSENNYRVEPVEPLLLSLRELSRRNGQRSSVLVLENLESIFGNEKLMSEFADIVILLDDPRYAQLRIKLLVVGTPAGVLDYFSRTKNQESVANRIFELSKVENLSFDQVQELVTKGFTVELQVPLTLEQVIEISRHVYNVTMGVAQRVHEYCEQLAYLIEDANGEFLSDSLDAADWNWLVTGLRQSYAVVEANLNSRDTAVARRNQVIFAIGKLRKHHFYSSDIESIIQKEFPDTIPETNMGVGSILAELTRGDDAILVRNPKIGHYRVKDPRYTMCIRTVLYKNKESGKVSKRHFKNG